MNQSIDTISDLKTKGFYALKYPPDLRVSVLDAVASWKKFFELSDVIKTALPYSNGGAGVGYELKRGIGNKADRKENFDISLGATEWLITNALRIQEPAAIAFVAKAISLVSILKSIILDFAAQAEKEFGLNGFAQEIADSEPAFFARFIHYFGDRQVGEETATSHVDQSGFTLHLFESAEGLQCLTYDKQWINMPVSEGETVIIPAMQMQLRSCGDLRALCHRVVATPETAATGRWSMVLFVQFKRTPKYDKDNYGRLQEKEPGFNYTMPIQEFSKMFK